MAAVTAERPVAIRRVCEEVCIRVRHPATLEHLAASISLNEFEEEVELGPSQGWATNDSERIARTGRKCGSLEKRRSGSFPRIGLDLTSNDSPHRACLDTHLGGAHGYHRMENRSGSIQAE
jgi:hypothetical protein